MASDKQQLRFHDVQVTVPSSWIDVSIVSLAGTDSRVFQPSLVIAREEAPGGKLSAFAKSQVSDFSRQVRNHKLVGQKDIKLGDKDAHVLEHNFASPDGVEVFQKQYFVISGPELIVLSVSCALAEYSQRKAQLEQLIKSIKIDG